MDKELFKITGFACSLFIVMLFMFLFIGNLICFPGNLAKVEQLRSDAKQANVLNSEAIMGQVTKWNQRIKSRQADNTIPIFCLTVPNGWDDMELIDVKNLAGEK